MKRITVVLAVVSFALVARAAMPTEEELLKTALDAQAGVVERTRAFDELRAAATERSLSVLTPLLADPAWSHAVCCVLEPMPGAAVDRALLEALAAARDDNVRAGLVSSLGHRHTAESVPVLAKLPGSSDPALADAALNALGDIATVPAADALLAHAPSVATSVEWADASLRAAETLRSSHAAKSGELYRAVKAKGPPAQAAAALIGLARASPHPTGETVAALRADEEQSRTAALAVIRSGEFGTPLTSAVGEAFPSLSPAVQVQVLSVLYDRGDRAAAPIARRALGATDRAVSAAGAKLLSAIGEPSDAPALLRLMVGPEEPALSARLALMRIPGPETTALLLEAFHGKDAEARVAALEVLVGRGHRALLSELLKPELFADEAFRPLAANAVLTLGTGDDLGRVLEFHRTLPLAQRGPLEAALRRIAAKHPSADAAATTVLAAAAQLPLGEAAPLYTILAGIGGDAALAAFSGMLNSSSADQRNAALRALGSWRDTAPTALLLDIASHDADPGVRTLAVRSATTLFTKSAFGGNNAPVPALVPRAIEGLRKTWAAAQPAEKSAVISALRSLKDPRAVAAAEELEKSVTRDP